jgi:hypothetical protein
MEVPNFPRSGSPFRTRTCIIVAGMHRSGTSAIARIVNLLGADISKDLLPPVPGNNDRGFWEPIQIVNIHDRLLRALDSSYDDPFPLPENWMETRAAKQAMLKLAEEIEKDFSERDFFVIKDPRISRLLPLWLKLLDSAAVEPIIVIPVRNPLETAASLKKRDQFSLTKSFLLYLRSNLEVELASRGRQRIFVSYSTIMSDWSSFASKLFESANGHLPCLRAGSIVEINEFLSADLYHNRFTRDQLSAATDVPTAAIEMFERMNCINEIGDEHQLEQAFDRLRERLDEATKLFQGVFIEERERSCKRLLELKKEEEIARHALLNELGELRVKSDDLYRALSIQSIETGRLNDKLSAAQMRIDDLDSVRLELTSEVARTNDQLLGSQTRVGNLNSMVASQALEITRLSRELSESRVVNLKLNSLREAHCERIVQLERAVQDASKAVTELQAKLTEVRSREDDAILSLNIATKELQSIKLSLSWRWTGPLRRLRVRLQTYSNLKLIDGSILFNRSWYLEKYQDVRDRKVNPAAHYLRYGAAEGRDPSPLFDSDWYLHKNPDVQRAGINPLVHYLQYGAAEGRNPHP